MKRLQFPPGPVLVSLSGTLIMVFVLAAVLVQVVAGGVGGVDPVVSFVWRAGFCVVLLWVEVHRQRMRHFLSALGVSRRTVLLGLLPLYLVLEALHTFGFLFLQRASGGG